MQFDFLTALLVVCVCFVQVSVTHPQNTQQNNDLINQAEETIKKLQQILQKDLEDFNNLKEQVEDAAQGSTAVAKQQLDEIIAKAQEQFEIIKQKAEKVGADITECLADSEDAFKALFDKFLQDELNCVQKEVDDALEIIKEGIQIVTELNKAVQDLPENLKACRSTLNSLGCITDVLANVASLNKELPGKIAKKIQEVTSFVGGIKVKLATCAITQVGIAGLAAAGIVADVAKCAADKIREDFLINTEIIL